MLGLGGPLSRIHMQAEGQATTGRHLGRCTLKPRRAGSHQELEEAGRTLPLCLRRERSSAHTLSSNFLPPEQEINVC